MKLFAVIPLLDGLPTIELPYSGHVLVAVLPSEEKAPGRQEGIYLLSGTSAEIATLREHVREIASYDQGRHELDRRPSATARAALNAWLQTRGLPTAKASETSRTIVETTLRRFAPDFALDLCDVSDPIALRDVSDPIAEARGG